MYKRHSFMGVVFLDYLSLKVGGILPHPKEMGLSNSRELIN